jgi:tetratricopeptide (TPR) repeat protein
MTVQGEVMGLFSGLFGKKDVEYYREKGLKFFLKHDFTEAIFNFEKGLSVAEIETDKGFFEDKIKECKLNLANKNYELAKTYLQAGDKEQAYDFAITCLRFASDTDMIAEIRQIVNSLEGEKLQEKLSIYEKEHIEADENLDRESYFEIIIENYPDFIKDEITKDERLRDILIAVNSGNLADADKIFQFSETDSVLYLKGLVNVLKGNFKEALPYYKKLAENKKEQLDEERWVEIVRLVKECGEGEELILHLFDNPTGNSLKNVIVEYLLANNKPDKAKAIVDVALKNMNADNFDINMVGNAGLVYFALKDYNTAMTHLMTVRNYAASSGTYIFSPEYAVPLALSLEHSGKFDDAFELILHLVKGLENKEIREIALRLSEKSSREDLKKELQLLL